MKTITFKMQTTEIDNRDHNYSEFKSDKHQNNAKDMHNIDDDDVQILLPKSKPTPGKEVFGQVKDINELKKITPRVKLLAHDATRLTELTKLSLTKKVPNQHKYPLWDQTKEELTKYCRTCAGLKLPLVDIFSEKGVQMRLSQQIKHLEDINPYDSLSTQMCMDCICDLKMSYKFFMQIKKAEVKLKSLYHTLSETAVRNMENMKAKSITDLSVEENLGEHLHASTSMSEDCASDSAGPKISAIYSLNTTPIKSEEPRKLMNTPPPIEKCDEVIIGHISDDNESIEEFDPDDPPFQPDTSDAGESDDELVTSHNQSPRAKMQKKERMKAIPQPSFSSTIIEQKNEANLQTKSSDAGNTQVPSQRTVPKQEPVLSSGTTKEFPKQPNILKRRLLMPPPRAEQADQINDKACPSNISDKNIGPREFKVQKLDMNNLLNIDNGPEDGIMYVTVKGTKPNELLLVKVKKMDKPVEKKDEKSLPKKCVEKKEKETFAEKIKPDTRDQIIEEQIEEYKKKREKLLGCHTGSNFNLSLEENQPRFMKGNDSSSKSMSSVESINLESSAEDTIITQPNEDLTPEAEDIAEEKPPSEKLHDNTTECISRLAKLKVKWEEAKRKKESLQRELDESYTEGNIEKLARILGEKEKNLQDFQDYLKQRRIVITRLKDEDIISLYEDRNNALLRNSLPDLIDETQPADYIPEEHYLECDYCPQTFASKEILEEHLKTHDYKIMHFCEDCSEVFSTNKAKRNHNIVCIKKLICKYCDIMLDSKGKKRQHEQKHCDSMFGQLCDVCGEKFKHQGTLDQHIKMQHMSWEKIFQCPKCPKKFAFKQKLSFHLKSVHTTLRAYLCEDCGADFKNPASLRHHRIRKHQPVGNKRECPVCHKLVPFYSLSKHMHTHKAYTIQCPHCDKMFKNSSTLKQHVRIHEDQRQYRCDTCGVGFNRRDGLRLHMRVHEKTDSRGLKECSCQVCGEKFPNHSTLVIHRNRVHKDGRQYTCHICNRSMISTRSLEWHMSHIHNESLPGIVKDEGDGALEKKRVSCYHCNKTFKTEMILRTHIKNTHMEKDPMKCLDCELTFTSEVRLRHHMMVTHNRLEGTLACPHCPKRFVNQLRLKTHMISHSEERPYTCEICGFNLKTKIQLIKHHQNRHSDERPLQCRYCPWRCKQVSALVCHERTHTNERPYSCSVCRQRFKYLGDKNKHERRHESLGGSGFKRIVPGRNIKPKIQEETSGSDQENEGLANVEAQLTEEQYEEHESQEFGEEQIVKFEPEEIVGEYEQEYEETSREASDAAEVIMNMEDTTVYTEEVTADNIESAEIMADEMMTNEILQSGTVVHLQQEDDSGKIQVIPVMLSLPDLSDANTEVNLATASIMYNN